MATRLTGKVKFYNYSRGFGFITPDGGGDDVFVHATSLADGLEISEGDKVSFEVVPDRQGKGKQQAASVQLD